MYGRILKSLNNVNLYRGMSKLKLKINVNLPQLLCIVVFVALNGEFGRFGGFCVGWDRDFYAKKGGMAGLTGKNGRESGI